MPTGRLVVTFPHKKSYFANDDHFVNHFRRYELSEMKARLTDAGFRSINIHKVLGPLEKITMCFVVFRTNFLENYKSVNRQMKDAKYSDYFIIDSI